MNKHNGFSLIEVLVTLVLVTVGILGMVTMQSRSIQYTQEAVQRNAAVELTVQLTEILRSNPDALFYKEDGKAFSPAYAEPSAADCKAPNTAQKKRDCWLERVQKTLPGAAGLLSNSFYICKSFSSSAVKKPNCEANGPITEIQLAWTVKPDSCPDVRAPDNTTCIYRTRIEL
ncbi:type IV pilus modification protein PilV [uncultured Pseudomonas sp.]|uniref:type IV pilus modification protein PilV n=1 Tax=uncultured Pseudomonas sp. TaxID=114707 RepID=UPI00260EF06F|nr:type IV pilus modification protein PilV [uncultured Pseudomonas sp.]